MEFIPYTVELPLKGMELQEKKDDKDEEYFSKLIKRSPKVKGAY